MARQSDREILPPELAGQATGLAMQGRLRELAALLLRGFRSRADLARHFGVTQRQIAKDIRYLDRRWEREQYDLTDRRKGRLLAELQLLKFEAWNAWKASKLPEFDETTRTPGPAGTEQQQVRRTTGPRAGDPRYLERVADCIAKECSILGIKAPEAATAAQLVNVNHLEVDMSRLSREAVDLICQSLVGLETPNATSQQQAEIEAAFLAAQDAPEIDEEPDGGNITPEQRGIAQGELGLPPLNGSNGHHHAGNGDE